MNPDRGIPETLLARFSDFVADRLGLHFPRERWRDLERGIGSAARDFGQADAPACIDRLMSAPLTQREIEMLASHLTVGETYFFREEKSFAALETHILPDLMRRRRDGEKRLRVQKGVFRFANSTVNPIAQEHIGATAFVEDDQTVAHDGSLRAGVVDSLDESGQVWIFIA